MTNTGQPVYREALVSDVPQIQVVRNLVKENKLPHPDYVTDADCVDFITKRGKGWVCTINNRIVGFAIADLQDHTIWALFVDPDFEARGIGKKLHTLMLNWYFKQTQQTVWLGTSPATRAAAFYAYNGWREVGKNGEKEIKFEMSYEEWKNKL